MGCFGVVRFLFYFFAEASTPTWENGGLWHRNVWVFNAEAWH